jgi:septal ring factor EnvC (AmiA/AmiB activator)
MLKPIKSYTTNKDLTMSDAQFEQAQMQIKNLAAQTEALKGMLNEANTSSLQLRSAYVLMQQHMQEMAQKNKALSDELAALKAPPVAEAPAPEQPSASN